MKNTQFKTEFARRNFEKGREEGREEGLRNAVLQILRGRLGDVPAELEAAIRSVSDQTTLNGLIMKLTQIRDDAEVRQVLASVVAFDRPGKQ